ncbi:MAG: hypothetical protein KAH97_05770 [Anaerolineales bacterium]|nr:hypothetical protein [Anaerolineales bacterium]
MSFLGRFVKSFTDLFYPKERVRRYDEAKTVPLTARLLAQALAGEGRRHAGIGYSKSENVEEGSSVVSLFSMMGESDGNNVLSDFGIIGVSQGEGPLPQAVKASNKAIRAFSASMTQSAVLQLLALDGDEQGAPFNQAVTDAFQEAVRAVENGTDGASFSMTAGLMFAEIVILGHLGNSRAYVVDHHHIERITAVNNAKDNRSSGRGSNENNLSQMSWNYSTDFAVYSRPIPRDGYILICTQGLPDAVPEHDIQRIVLEFQEPQAICDGLIYEAQRRKDQIDLCVIALHFPPDFGAWR